MASQNFQVIPAVDLLGDDAVRLGHDMSSLRCAIHAAAPCPIPVKQKMIEWWGPIIWEYYGGTEGNGLTMCNSSEWLAHKGTVGRAVVGELRICDDAGNEDVDRFLLPSTTLG